MTNYYTYFKQSRGNRDLVFQDALNYLNKTPAKIIEIGCLRDLSEGARRGDGWSSMHFAEYISQYGGELIVCDINDGSLANCSTAIDSLDIKKSFNLIDGTKYLKDNKNEKYDLVFLDGSDDPDEMYNQYLLIKDRAEFVLCDDYHAKGSTMKNNKVSSIIYKWDESDHELALIYNGVTSSIKKMIIIE